MFGGKSKALETRKGFKMSNSDELINGLSFEEKLTNLKIIHPESGNLMSTVTTLDEFPGSFSLVVDVDLFNIKADHKYQIRVYIKYEGSLTKEILIHASNVIIPSENFTYFKNGLGIANGQFVFSMTPEYPGNYQLIFEFHDYDNVPKKLDAQTRYLYIIKR